MVLASGGFEWNPRLQEAFLPNPVTPISAPSNTGDGLELGLAAGGAVTAMRAVWGVPVLQDPAHVYDGRPSGPDGERGTHAAGFDHGERRRPAVRQRGGQLSRPEQGLPGGRPEHRRVREHPGLAGGRQRLPFKVFHRRHPGRSGAVLGGQRATPSTNWRRPAGSTRSAWPRPSPSSTRSPPTVTTRCSAAARALPTDTWAIRGSRTRAWRRWPRDRSTPSRSGPARWAPAAAWSPTRTAGCWTAADDPSANLFAAGNVAATVFADAYPGGGATLGSAITRAYAVGRALADTLSTSSIARQGIRMTLHAVIYRYADEPGTLDEHRPRTRTTWPRCSSRVES